MKLSYRGATYEGIQPTLEVTEGEILGKYRGASWRGHIYKEMPVPQSGLHLSYRGVAYTTGQVNAQTEAQPVQPVTAKAGRSHSMPVMFKASKEIALVHRANLQRNLEHRLQIARERGDQRLVQLLEAESRQLV